MRLHVDKMLETLRADGVLVPSYYEKFEADEKTKVRNMKEENNRGDSWLRWGSRRSICVGGMRIKYGGVGVYHRNDKIAAGWVP